MGMLQNNSRIRIHCDQEEKTLSNFWNNIVFHPTDAIEDDWGKRILDRIAADNAVRTVRIYTMFEDIVTLDEAGKMQYDFTLNDYRLDYLLSKGFDILLSYAFVPPFITVNPAQTKPRYKGKKLCTAQVRDYDKWEEMCRVYTQHIVDRYGEDTVAKWHLNCYNEPDSSNYFFAESPDIETKIEAFCKLYDGFEAGILSVSRKLQIGGPALSAADDNFRFLEGLLKHIKATGRRINFINFHSYGTSATLIRSGAVPLGITNSVIFPAIRNIRRVVRLCGYEHLPLIWGEWGATTAGYANLHEAPEHAFRDTEVYAAYYVKLLTLWDELGAPFDKMILCLSGQEENPADFVGYRNFFTLHFYPKPIYNAFVLAAKLGTKKLGFFTDNTIASNCISVLPSKHEDGHMSILLSYADDALARELEPAEVTITLFGIENRYAVKRYVIDKHHANALTKYRALGCPDDPTEDEMARIRDFATLKAEDAGSVSPDAADIHLTMENNAVVLLELFPQTQKE